MVIMPSDGIQSIIMKSYASLTRSTNCLRINSLLITFTSDTSIAESSILEGSISTPSSWCIRTSSKQNSSSFTIFIINVASVFSISSGSGYPKLIESEPCGSVSIKSTFLPADASPIPKFTHDVVLAVPPFWFDTVITLHIICLLFSAPFLFFWDTGQINLFWFLPSCQSCNKLLLP